MLVELLLVGLVPLPADDGRRGVFAFGTGVASLVKSGAEVVGFVGHVVAVAGIVGDIGYGGIGTSCLKESVAESLSICCFVPFSRYSHGLASAFLPS